MDDKEYRKIYRRFRLDEARRHFVPVLVAVGLIWWGLVCIQEHETEFLTLYVLAGSFAVSALIEKVWFK
jgi:hypothetical protein